MTRMTGFTLRDYQVAAVTAAMGSIAAKRNDLIVMPTASGKTVVLAGIVERLIGSNQRILIVSHVREILTQIADAMRLHLPGLDFGIYCAGLKQFEPGKQLVIASIQSLYRRTYSRGFDVVLVDECHLIQRLDRPQSMYHQLFEFLRRTGLAPTHRRRLPIIGLSATPYRLDSGYLHEGTDALFERIVFDVPVPPLIARGILAPLTTREVEEIDFSDLPIHAHEYVVRAFEEKSNWLGETARTLAITRRLAEHRKKWLLFACSIRHAIAIAEMLTADGISCVAVHHGMKRQERDNAIRMFREGETRALVTVNVLSLGFDSPNIDCIVSIRPTLSTGLWIQQVGRGMRNHPAKHDCLLLDYSGNLRRHGPLTDFMPRIVERAVQFEDNRPPKKKSDRPTKLCPTCATELDSRTRQCHNCGKLFLLLEARPADIDPIYPSPIPDDTQMAIRDRRAAKGHGSWRARIAPEDEAIITDDGTSESDIRETLQEGQAPLYLEKRGAVYYYLRKIPERARPRIGLTFWRFSLRTHDYDRARKLALRLAARHDRLLEVERPVRRPPPSDFPYLSTEEMATIIGVNPGYAKQMRHYGTGPRFYTGGAPTRYGWRLIVYRMEDITAWRNGRTYIKGRDGRTWRLPPEAFTKPFGPSPPPSQKTSDPATIQNPQEGQQQ